ncbi:hypothetical protein BDQ17DRAFT_1330842 [Cyathus striatus]|nr:hypothetical protein BDQ17DRAFT_1330842 [Cyathus striatus]
MWPSFVLPKLTSRNKHIYCLALFSAFCIACISTGIGIGYGLRVKDFNGGKDDGLEKNSSIRTVTLEAELISIDPTTSTLVMDWVVTNDSCVYFNQDCTSVALFFDLNLLLSSDSPSTNRTNDLANVPIFIWNPVNFGRPFFMVAIFRTTSMLFTGTEKSSSTLQNYPFDTYGAVFVVYGNETQSNDLVNIEVDGSDGVAVGFKTTSNTAVSNQTGLYFNEISIERGGLIKAYVLCIIMGIWLVTLVFVASVMKIMFRYKQPKEVFAVPIATMFAFTSLRSSMPGAPTGFGATMAIITTTSVVMFGYMVVLSNAEAKQVQFEPPIFPTGKKDVEAGTNGSNSTAALTIEAPQISSEPVYMKFDQTPGSSPLDSSSTLYTEFQPALELKDVESEYPKEK